MSEQTGADIILETQRMILKFQQMSDVDFLVALWTNEKVSKFTGSTHNAEWLRAEFEKTATKPKAEKYDLWVVQEKQSGKLLGHCGFIDKEVEGKTEYDISYFFAPEYWGKGYATQMAQALKEYAFNVFGLERIVALIDPRNIASAKVAQRIGMKVEKNIIRAGDAVRDMYVIEK